MRVLVTGANGFVGCVLCTALTQHGYAVRGAVRSTTTAASAKTPCVAVGGMTEQTDWSTALADMDIVVHLAARAHVMKEVSNDPLAAFREVNLHGTENLARQAARAGVGRFVFVSSIKVNGEETRNDQVYSEADIPAPQDAYATSKWEAEQALHRVAHETGMEVVILRLPLVYGPGVKGNFAQLLTAVARGIPLPLASVHNRRSLLFAGNLVSALMTVATHPAAAGKTYMVSDGEDISTTELLRSLAAAIGVSARLFFCPSLVLRFAGALTGRSEQIRRLLGSLQVDSDKMRRELNWQPPYSLHQGLQATADWYRNTHL